MGQPEIGNQQVSGIEFNDFAGSILLVVKLLSVLRGFDEEIKLQITLIRHFLNTADFSHRLVLLIESDSVRTPVEHR